MQPITTPTTTPEELVTITNSKTNQIKRVKRSELPQYGLPIDYQSQADIQAKSIMSGAEPMVSGNDVGSNAVRLVLQGSGYTAQTADQLKQKNTQDASRKDALAKAKAVYDIIQQGESGKLTGQQYKDALQAAASQFVASQAFAQGGKNLTANELAILSGQMPVIKQKTGNLLEKSAAFVGGYKVPQTGEVMDDPQTLKNKMILAINTLDPKAKIAYPKGARGTSKAPSGTSQNLVGLNTVGTKVPGVQLNDNQVAQLVGNAAGDVKDLVNGILNIPANKLAEFNKAKAEFQKNKDPKVMQKFIEAQQPGSILTKMGQAYLSSLNEDLGRPLEGGDIVGKIATHAGEHPVKTALDVLPFVGGASKLGLIGKTGEVADATKVADIAGATKATEAVAPVEAGVASKLPAIKSDLAGRAATQIAVPDITSVTKSEKIMADALRTTDAVTRRGMAKQLEEIVPKVGDNITTYAKGLDKKIGPQPKGEIMQTIDDNLETSSPVQAHPEEYNLVKRMVEKELGTTGVMPGTIDEATSLEKINNARIALNKSIPSSWFKNDMPTVSKSDIVNAIKWDYSNQLKNVLAEADQSTGYFKRAIDIQHTALQAGPVLAREAFKSSGGLGRFGIIRSAFNKIATTPEVVNARNLQGPADELTQQIISGQLPAIEAGQAPTAVASGQLPAIVPATKTIDPQVINQIIKGKAPAQAARFERDMRYKVGNPEFRGSRATKTTQQAAKKKYK